MVNHKKYLYLLAIITMLAVFITNKPVYASAKQAEIVTKTEEGDLTILFDFDQEIVDLQLISPTGVQKNKTDPDVSYTSGDLWCTYRIKNAELGTWSVAYELGSNTQINYSIIEDNYGLWIQNFEWERVSENKVAFSFEADFDEADIDYYYTIQAISTTKKDQFHTVWNQTAVSNIQQRVEVNLDKIPSDGYIFRLSVFYDDGDTELFDSMDSEKYEHTNPIEFETIEDFRVYVNPEDLVCTVNWSGFKRNFYNAYQLIVTADGKSIYEGELNKATICDFVYPQGTKSLEIGLAYKIYTIWSEPKTKKIILNDKFLFNGTGKVTNASQVILKYDVEQEHELYVSVNEGEGDYKVNGKGSLAFDIVEGKNHVYAEMESEDLIYYIVDTDVLYDAYPPRLILYDNLDGKAFDTDCVSVLGKVTGGDVLRVNGTNVELKDSGEFQYDVNLTEDETVVELEAEDENGNVTKTVLTLYHGVGDKNLTAPKRSWNQFLALMIASAISLIAVLYAFIFMRKETSKNKNKKKCKFKIVILIIWDLAITVLEVGCIRAYIKTRKYNKSTDFILLAKESVAEAADQLKIENTYKIASITGLFIVIISILLTVFIFKWKKKSKSNQSI